MLYNKLLENKKGRINVLLFFIVLGLIISGCYLLFNLAFFNLTNVEILGTDKYSKSEILSSINLEEGKNIIISYLKMDKQGINKLAYIDKIEVKFNSCNTLKIIVTERKYKYIAFDKKNEEYYRIDSNGYILEKVSKDKRKEDELLIYGISFDDEVVLGTKLDDVYMSKFKVYENILKSLRENNINDDITLVNFENSLTTITINDKLNIVFLNDENLKHKIDSLKEILEKLGEDAKGTLDLTVQNPIFSADY